MSSLLYPKIYLYRRIVQAKLFIDDNYFENIDLNNIADEAYFSKFHFIRLILKTPLKFIPGCFAEKNGWKKKSNFKEMLQ